MEKNKLDKILTHVVSIGSDLKNVKSDVEKMRKTVSAHTDALDALVRGVKNLQDEKTMRDKGFARLNFRTEKLLGKKLYTVDAEFEEQYRGTVG